MGKDKELNIPLIFLDIELDFKYPLEESGLKNHQLKGSLIPHIWITKLNESKIISSRNLANLILEKRKAQTDKHPSLFYLALIFGTKNIEEKLNKIKNLDISSKKTIVPVFLLSSQNEKGVIKEQYNIYQFQNHDEVQNLLFIKDLEDILIIRSDNTVLGLL